MTPKTNWIGRRLSHYTILEEIHASEMTSLFRARDDKLNREVALKVLPLDRVGDPDKQAKFVREAKAAAALEHPHVAVIHEIDEADGTAFIAMELLEGESLASRLSAGRLGASEALEIAVGIAAGLAYAHERGVVHRDVKPDNVMLTAQGHPKLVDFGIARVLDADKSPFLAEAGEEESARFGTTHESVIAGTVQYMSPEQARGGTVDPRSDVFSFGVLLYHLLSGRPPFEGPSRLDTLHAILRDPAPRLQGLSGEERQVLDPIVQRCLEKEPDRRYPNMGVLLDELKKAKAQIETAGWTRARRLRWALGSAIAAGALIALSYWIGRTEPLAPPQPETPSLAVLHFDNLSGDPELDWLRTGLTEMLVTDLAQSPEIEVLTTDRLHQILEDMGRDSATSLPSDDIAELARRAGVQNVLLGSVAKAGPSLRISARLQDANTGDVVLSETTEGQGQESIFRLVDALTRSIRENLEVELAPDDLDRDLRDVTTASVEAYRHYAEGIHLHERFREEDAIPHFQRAVELDPGFSMALAKLGVVHSNLGLHEMADEFAERALAHVDRLTERERLYVEGWYYSRNPETAAKAVESYRKAIETYPDHGSARHNLALLLMTAERYREAIEQLEELRRRGMVFPATYEILANAYRAMGDVDRARAVLEEFADRNPDVWATLIALAELEIAEANYDRGLEFLERAKGLGASKGITSAIEWQASIYREDWSGARERALSLLESDNPGEKFRGGQLLAITELYQGELDNVLRLAERFETHEAGSMEGEPRAFKARVLLETGDYAAARDEALSAEMDDKRGEALVVAAVASARLGELEQASDLIRRYVSSRENDIGVGPERVHEFMLGELALAHGDTETAIRHFREAESMLSPRGYQGLHSVVWYALATAHEKAGDLDAAIGWYERIASAREERLFDPIPYVRSFYHLAELHERAGRDDEARASYRRFVDHWGGGQIDRDRLERAAQRLR